MMRIEDADVLAASKHNSFKLFGVPMYQQFTYIVPIESDTDPDVTVGRAWIFGTGRTSCLGLPGKDCIRRDQIEWYKQSSNKIPADDLYRQNGIAFMHHAL